LLCHQPGELELDLRLGQRVRESLVRANRDVPDDPFASVVGGHLERAAGSSVADRSAHYPFGVESVESRLEAAGLGADRAVSRYLDVVEKELPLLVGCAERGRDVLALQAGRVGVDNEEKR